MALRLASCLEPFLAVLVLEPLVPLPGLCVVVALEGVSRFLLFRRLARMLVSADLWLSSLRGRVLTGDTPCLPS